MKLRIVVLIAILLGGTGHIFFRPTSQVEAKEMTNCVTLLEPVQAGEQASRVLNHACFDNPAAAMRFATRGQVNLPETASQAAVDAAYKEFIGSSQTSLTSYLILRLWNSTSRNGGILNDWFGNSACIPGSSYAVPNIGSTYNDKAESGESFSGCSSFEVYQHIDYGGPYYAYCNNYCSTFGSFVNNHVSSWKAYY